MATKTKSKFKAIMIDILELIGIFILVQLLMTYVIANDKVVGTSMEPNFTENDRVFANRNAKLHRGDVIVLKAPDNPSENYIKRIIGLPGDTIKVENDQLYVNGKKVSEPYLEEYKKKQPKGTNFTDNFTLDGTLHEKKVPKNEYFVLGDNRPVSKDGRIFGFVNKDAIQGVVVMRYWPFNKIQFYN